MGRKKVQPHHRAVGEVRNLVQAGDRRDRRASADVDEDAVGAQPPVADRDLLLGDKTGMTFVNGAALQRLQRALDASPRGFGDGVLFARFTAFMSTPIGPPMVTP